MMTFMTTKPTKRGTVTEEHREESRRLKVLWESRKTLLSERGYGTQEAFGQHFGIGNQAAVGFFLNGKTRISPKAAAAFARGLECKISDFSPRLAKILDSADPAPGAWPFEDVDRARFERLTQRQKGRIEQALIEALDKLEAEQSEKRQARVA